MGRRRPIRQSSLDIELRGLTRALATRASTACRDIRFQRPSAERDSLTKLCPQFGTPVCTENLHPDVVVMKSAKDRV